MNKLSRTRQDLLSTLQHDFSRLLYPFKFPELTETSEVMASDWMPAIDVQDEDNQFLIHADVPGVSSKNIEISMQDNVLLIKGHRESQREEKGENYVLTERSNGSFMRRISLPENVNEDKISAECKNGVLEIVLPKSKRKGVHKITVKER